MYVDERRRARRKVAKNQSVVKLLSLFLVAPDFSAFGTFLLSSSAKGGWPMVGVVDDGNVL